MFSKQHIRARLHQIQKNPEWSLSLMEFLGNPLKNGGHFTALISGDGLPWWLSGKESASNQETRVQSLAQEDLGRRNGNPLQHSCLKNPMERGGWDGEPASMGSQRVGHSWAQHTAQVETWDDILKTAYLNIKTYFKYFKNRWYFVNSGSHRVLRWFSAFHTEKIPNKEKNQNEDH